VEEETPKLPWMTPIEEPEGGPPWDPEEAELLIGKRVLVGITNLASDGKTVKSQAQYHGRVTKAEQGIGISLECEGAWAGKILVLPPAPTKFFPADRGEYRLRSTGEVVTDPDFVTTWSVTEPSKS
jgi:hypothetical protein